MIRYRCDSCGVDLDRDGADHFIVKIEAFAAAGKLEFTREELARDHEAEIRELMDNLANRSPDEIEDTVYRSFRYDLCIACHRRFIQSPIAGATREDSGSSEG